MNSQCKSWGHRPLIFVLISLTSLFVAGAVGCNERDGGRALQESKLRLVAVLYSQYQAAHDGQAPQDAGEFKKFVEALGPGVIERAGLKNVEELLTSARDGKPIAIKYRSEAWALDGAIGYEQEGVDGTRMMATELGGVSQISDEQFLSRLEQSN